MDLTQFKAFIAGHREQHPAARLPDYAAAPGMYAAWFKVLLRRGAADARALEDASARMLTEPAKHHADHFPVLCSYAEQAARARGGQANRDLSTREGAEAAAKGCKHCAGTGTATVYHPRPDAEKKIAPTSAAYCVCAAGRWIEKNHAAKQPEIRKRIPDLADVLAGRSVWTAEPADDEDWNDRAGINWTMLDSEEREAWLDLAAERLPCWARGSKANVLLAVAWAYDSRLVIDPPPPAGPAPRRGPRHVLDADRPTSVSWPFSPTPTPTPTPFPDGDR